MKGEQSFLLTDGTVTIFRKIRIFSRLLKLQDSLISIIFNPVNSYLNI